MPLAARRPAGASRSFTPCSRSPRSRSPRSASSSAAGRSRSTARSARPTPSSWWSRYCPSPRTGCCREHPDRPRRFGRSHWPLRLIALTAVLSLGLSYLAAGGAIGWGIEAIGGALVLLQTALLILFAPSLAAGLISSEREGGTWTLLRATPLSAGAILRGKLLSAAWPLVLLLCATLPGYLIMAAVEPALASRAQRVLLSLALTAVFAILASTAAGSIFRSTATATTASYLVLLAVCLG